jgi:hypothetical protein
MFTPRRFTASHPCPICGGHDGLVHGQGVRCYGYLDSTGKYARCTREEQAGGLPQNGDGTFSHRLHGNCLCGRTHGDAPDPAGTARRHVAAAPSTPRRRSEQRFRSYFTLAASLRHRHGDGTEIRHWIYRDAAGLEVFRVLRVDYPAPDGSKAKSYRPCHQAGDGRWLLSRPAGPLPLYNLAAILAAPPEATIVILEGEKCTDLAASIGLRHAATSAHGAKAPQLTDWSPLAGRSVALIGDADTDGMGYVEKIAALLAALDPPARVHIVTLPGLDKGEDIEQFIEARRDLGRTDADILAELHELIAAGRTPATAPPLTSPPQACLTPLLA